MTQPQEHHTAHDIHERQREQQIHIRQVTAVQLSWTEAARGEPGAFTLQLILDHGVADDMLRPTAADLQVLLPLLHRGGTAMFDTVRKVLIFPGQTLSEG